MFRLRRDHLIGTLDNRFDNDAKVTDSSPQTIYEEVKSSTITFAAIEYGRVSVIEAEIGMNWTGLVGQHSVSVTLGYSIENSGDAAKTAPDAVVGVLGYNGAGTHTDCVDNTFTPQSVGVDRTGEYGTSIIVRFWLKYAVGGQGASSPTAYCIRNARVTYDTISKVHHG